MPTYDYGLLNPFKKSSYEPSTHHITTLGIKEAFEILAKLSKEEIKEYLPSTEELLDSGLTMSQINDLLINNESWGK